MRDRKTKNNGQGPKIPILERKIPFFLISRHLMRGNKWTLLFVILLMSTAFINLVFVNSLLNGVVKSSEEQIVNTIVGNITMSPDKGSQYFTNQAVTLGLVRPTPGVKAASGHTLLPASLTRKDVERPSPIIAIVPSAEKKTTTVSEKMVEGKYLEDGDTDQIVLGRQVAGGEDVELNSTSLRGAKVGEKLLFSVGNQSKWLTVKGIFYTKYFEADSQAFVTRGTLDQLLPSMKGKATSILIRTEDGTSEDEVIASLKKAVPDATYETWRQVNGLMKTVAKSFVTINALLTTVGFVIAAVVIFIIVYVDISNKRRQIGILRAIGIKSYLVSSTYILQSTIYAVVGVLLGAAIFFAIIVPYFKIHPFAIPLGDVNLYAEPVNMVWRSITIVLVSIVSGTIPAVLATRKNILDEIAGR